MNELRCHTSNPLYNSHSLGGHQSQTEEEGERGEEMSDWLVIGNFVPLIVLTLYLSLLVILERKYRIIARFIRDVREKEVS